MSPRRNTDPGASDTVRRQAPENNAETDPKAPTYPTTTTTKGTTSNSRGSEGSLERPSGLGFPSVDGVPALDQNLVTPSRYLRLEKDAVGLAARRDPRLQTASPGLLTRLCEGDYNPFEQSFGKTSDDDDGVIARDFADPGAVEDMEDTDDNGEVAGATKGSSLRNKVVDNEPPSTTTSTSVAVATTNQIVQLDVIEAAVSTIHTTITTLASVDTPVQEREEYSSKTIETIETTRSTKRKRGVAKAQKSNDENVDTDAKTKRSRPAEEVDLAAVGETASAIASMAASFNNQRSSVASSTNTQQPPPNESSAEKKKRLLERNRIAASKCRERKKQWVQSMEEQSDKELTRNTQLHFLISQLSQQITDIVETIGDIRRSR